MNNTEALKSIFKNIDENTLKNAFFTAQTLSNNPQIKNAFANSDLSELTKIISDLNPNDKEKILKELKNPKNSQLLNAIKNNIK